MRDRDKTKEQLLDELIELRRQVAILAERAAECERAEDALRTSEERCRHLAETFPLPIWQTGPHNEFIACNHHWEEYTGQTAEEAKNNGWMKMIHPDDLARIRHTIQTEIAGGECYQCEHRLWRASDGSYRWHLARGVPRKGQDGTVLGWFGCAMDIDDLKQAERELAKSKTVLQAAVDCLPFNFFAIGPDGRYMLQNAISKAQHGESVLGKRPEDVCRNEHDRAVWSENNRRAFAGEKVEGEVTLSLGGQRRAYYNVIVPIRDDRESYGILGVNIDITERKQAEEALRRAHDELEQKVAERTVELQEANVRLQQEVAERRRAEEATGQINEQLQTIYEEMIEGLLITDIETRRFVRVNPSLCRMLGYSEAELLAASLNDIHPPEEVRNDLERFQAAAEGRVTINESRPVLRKDGSIFYADISGRRILYEGRPCLLALFRDITERKQAQEALRQSHDELRAIYEQVVDGIIIADDQTWRPLRANLAFCRMLGYSQEEVLSITPEQVHPPEVLPVVREHCQAAKEGRIAKVQELPFVRKDGRTIYADVVSSEICYDGQSRWISFFHDVTERRQARMALERERRTLKHMLRASDHERQLIAYDIHDGLAQQLAGAIMQFQVYEQFRDSKPEEAKRAYDGGLTLLRQGHCEARRLISGVRPPILDESGVMAAIAHLVHDPAFDQGPTIDFRSRVTFNRLAPVLENVVYRIVQEGLANARQHSGSKKILLSLMQRGDRLRIKIQDWGKGFDPKTVQENRFGLEGIRERARLLGGKCSIKSKVGEGTSINVELPVVEPDALP